MLPRFTTLLLILSLGIGRRGARAQAFYYLPPLQVAKPAPPGAVFVAQVVDARAQRTSVGRVLLNILLPPVPATFQEGVPAAFQAFFNQYAPGRPGGQPLVLRLTSLAVGETPKATASLIGDFYAAQPDSSYRRVAHVAQTLTQAARLPGKAPARLSGVLSTLLFNTALLARDTARWQPAGPAYPAAYVRAAAPAPAELLPALAPGAVPRAGLYHTLPEFWANQPSEPGLPEVETHPYLTADWAGTSQVLPYRRAAGQRVPATNVWGFSDGQRFYLHQGPNFYPLERRGEGFVFYGRIGDDPAFQAAADLRSSTAGTSGLLARATAPSPEKRAMFSFDPLTGGVSLDQAAIAPPLAARPAQVFVYRPRGAKGPAVRVRLADGQAARELVPGDYLDFSPPADQPIQVTLLPASGPEVPLLILPTGQAALYLECRPAEALPLRQVKEAVGAAAVTRLLK